MVAQPTDSLLILASGDSWQARHQVTALVASEAAAERRVDLALFFGALAAWCEGRWGVLDPRPPLQAKAIERSAFPSLEKMLDDARETGRVGLYACSTSVRLLDLDAALVQSRVDAIMGWQSFARMTQQAARTLTF